MGRSPGADRPVPRHPEQRHRRVRAARRESGGLSGQLRQRQPDLPLPKRDQHEPVMSVSAVSVVVRTTDHDAAIQRYKRLLGPPVPRIAGDVTAGPALVSCVLVSCAPCVEVPLFDLLRRGQREPPGLPYGGSTRFSDTVIPHVLPFAGMADRHPRVGCRQRRAIGVSSFLLLLDQGFRSRSSLLLW